MKRFEILLVILFFLNNIQLFSNFFLQYKFAIITGRVQYINDETNFVFNKEDFASYSKIMKFENFPKKITNFFQIFF